MLSIVFIFNLLLINRGLRVKPAMTGIIDIGIHVFVAASGEA
jgi:hypothetical protein